MTYRPTDFGPDKRGPQIPWLRERLTAHGIGVTDAWDDLRERVAAFQRAQGWSGAGADGLPGPKTLLRLSASPSPVPTPTGIDLSPWKWTSPIGEADHPREVWPIGDFAYEPWLVRRSDGSIEFRAPVNGVTTSGSHYSRSELREMQPKAWSVSDGLHHRLVGACQVLAMPGRKTDYTPGVVFGQIHGPVDDIVILLANLNGDVIAEESLGKDKGSVKHKLLTGYRIGDPLVYELDAHRGGIDVTVNGQQVRLDQTVVDGYSKAGCYLRGNASNATGAGAVLYTALERSHAA